MVFSNAELRIQGAAACITCIVVMTAVPLIEWFLFYKQDERLWHIPFATWGGSLLPQLLGLIAFAWPAGFLLGCHAILGTALAAAMGAFNTMEYLSLKNNCLRTQLSFRGCANCECAFSDSCTSELLSARLRCNECEAWGRDLCADADNHLLPYVGVIALVLVAAPCIFSILCLVRVEAEQGNVSNRLQYARNMVSHSLAASAPLHSQTISQQAYYELLRLMLAYGREEDRVMAHKACEHQGIQVHALMASSSSGSGSGHAHPRQVVPLSPPPPPFPFPPTTLDSPLNNAQQQPSHQEHIGSDTPTGYRERGGALDMSTASGRRLAWEGNDDGVLERVLQAESEQSVTMSFSGGAQGEGEEERPSQERGGEEEGEGAKKAKKKKKKKKKKAVNEQEEEGEEGGDGRRRRDIEEGGEA